MTDKERKEVLNLAKRLRIIQRVHQIDLHKDYPKASLIITPFEYPIMAERKGKRFSGIPIVVCETITGSTIGNVPFKISRTFEECKDWEEK